MHTHIIIYVYIYIYILQKNQIMGYIIKKTKFIDPGNAWKQERKAQQTLLTIASSKKCNTHTHIYSYIQIYIYQYLTLSDVSLCACAFRSYQNHKKSFKLQQNHTNYSPIKDPLFGHLGPDADFYFGAFRARHNKGTVCLLNVQRFLKAPNY